MNNRIFYSLFFLLLLTACGTDDSPAKESEVFEVRSIGTLSTSEYTVGKIIKLDDKGDWWKWGDRKILISCKAKIKAGVNLNKIKDSDILVDGKRIEIQLPEPEIISFEMDPDQIRTEMTDVNGFRSDFSQADKNKILQLGEKAIRTDLRQLSILSDAEANAIAFLKDFYKTLGFEEIIIHGTEQDKGDTNTRL